MKTKHIHILAFTLIAIVAILMGFINKLPGSTMIKSIPSSNREGSSISKWRYESYLDARLSEKALFDMSDAVYNYKSLIIYFIALSITYAIVSYLLTKQRKDHLV